MFRLFSELLKFYLSVQMQLVFLYHQQILEWQQQVAFRDKPMHPLHTKCASLRRGIVLLRIRFLIAVIEFPCILNFSLTLQLPLRTERERCFISLIVLITTKSAFAIY